MAVRLFYLDDSGAEDTGFVVYSWVEVDITAWRDGLRSWLDWRHSLTVRHQIPVLTELHATKFVGGRGEPSLDPAWNKHKSNRHQVAEEACARIGTTPSLQVATVYRRTAARRRSYYAERTDVYAELVRLIDTRLASAGDLGILIMDGDGSDPSYVSAHRNLKLATRAIIEDPVFQHSHASQWVQMADLVAYVTYQHLLRHPGKQFAWPWYSQHLQRRDALGAPQLV